MYPSKIKLMTIISNHCLAVTYYEHSSGEFCHMVNGNNLVISNLGAWSMKHLGWTESPHPAETRDQFIPLRRITHSQSHEETPAKIPPPPTPLSSQNTRIGCTNFFSPPASPFMVQQHVQNRRPVLSNHRGTETVLTESSVIKDSKEVKGQVLPKFPRHREPTIWINRAGKREECGNGFDGKTEWLRDVWNWEQRRLFRCLSVVEIMFVSLKCCYW